MSTNTTGFELVHMLVGSLSKLEGGRRRPEATTPRSQHREVVDESSLFESDGFYLIDEGIQHYGRQRSASVWT
jgi:hypothetical protein